MRGGQRLAAKRPKSLNFQTGVPGILPADREKELESVKKRLAKLKGQRSLNGQKTLLQKQEGNHRYLIRRLG